MTKFTATAIALALVTAATVSGCGDGSPPDAAPQTTTGGGEAQCGPTGYASIEARSDSDALECSDKHFVSTFVLTAAPRSLDLSGFRYREKLHSSEVLCQNFTPRVFSFGLDRANRWADTNRFEVVSGVLPADCVVRVVTEEQWTFPNGTADVTGRRAACGGTWDSEGWQTFTKKYNVIEIHDSRVRSCKGADSGGSACIDFEISPALSIAPAASAASASGGRQAVKVDIRFQAPANRACRDWTVAADADGAHFLTTAAISPRRDATGGSLTVEVAPNNDHRRKGVVVVQYGAGTRLARFAVDQEGTPVPSIDGLWAGEFKWNCEAYDGAGVVIGNSGMKGSVPVVFSLFQPEGTSRIEGWINYGSGPLELLGSPSASSRRTAGAVSLNFPSPGQARGDNIWIHHAQTGAEPYNTFAGTLYDGSRIVGVALNGLGSRASPSGPRGCSAFTGASGTFEVTKLK